LPTAGALRAFAHRQNPQQVWIEIHPLWQQDHDQVTNAVQLLREASPTCTPGLLNPFLLLRRPADFV
jgi:hypothetical protein